MKYTIEGFYQPKLMEAGCDITDAMMLRWFVDFAATGSMISAEDGGTEYFCVKYGAVAEEFPILGINTVRGITKRFDAFVEKGILGKKTFRTTKGLLPFFCKTDRLVGMLYENNLPDKKEDGDGGIKITGVFGGGPSEPAEEGMNGGSDPVGTAVQRGSEHGFRGGMNDGSDPSYNPSANIPRENPSAAAGTGFPANRTEKRAEAERFIKSCIKKLFAGHYVFDANFAPAVASLAEEFGLGRGDIPGYLEFVLRRTRERKPVSVVNLFRSLAKNPGVMQDFLETRRRKSQPAAEENRPGHIVCPVCGKEHAAWNVCPVCGCTDGDRGDKERLALCRKIWALPPDAREKYRQEILGLEKEFSPSALLQDRERFSAYKAAEKLINAKYGLVPEET